MGEVQRVYVMPLKQYNLSIDSDCHRKFLALLAARDAASFRVAASDLSLLREGRVSLPRLRVSSYDAEAPIMLPWPRGRVQLQLLLHAWNCARHLLTRWMEGDPAVCLADVSEFTAKQVPPTAEGAEEALRQRLLPRRQDFNVVLNNSV